MLTGYKSYVLAATSVLYAIAGWYAGTLDVHAAIAFALGGGAVATLRAALPTTVQQIIGPLLDAIVTNNNINTPPK